MQIPKWGLPFCIFCTLNVIVKKTHKKYNFDEVQRLLLKHSLVGPQFSNFITLRQLCLNLFTYSIPKRHLDLALPPIGNCMQLLWVLCIDIESLQNRLLKVCYVPATSASLPRVSFFFSFLFFVAAAIDSTNEANKVPLSSLYCQMSMVLCHLANDHAAAKVLFYLPRESKHPVNTEKVFF